MEPRKLSRSHQQVFEIVALYDALLNRIDEASDYVRIEAARLIVERVELENGEPEAIKLSNSLYNYMNSQPKFNIERN